VRVKKARVGADAYNRLGLTVLYLVADLFFPRRPDTGGNNVLVYLREFRFPAGPGSFPGPAGNREPRGSRGKSFPPGRGAGDSVPCPPEAIRAPDPCAG